MEKGKMKISEGVEALLANAHTPPLVEDFYTFEGDLCQMSIAANVARNLGLDVGVCGGLPYVVSKKDYDMVVKYIIDNQIEGYWHYRSNLSKREPIVEYTTMGFFLYINKIIAIKVKIWYATNERGG